MANSNPTFIITREDQVVDPVTFSTSALRVGRQVDCEILLNHPTVSKLHAGFNEIDGRFYLINLSSSHPVMLNSRLVEVNQSEEVADGDLAQIGSFFLQLNRSGGTLKIHVSFNVAPNILDMVETAAENPAPAETVSTSPKVADALKEFWDKRTRDKAARPSPLHPKQVARPGKAQFSWKPTRDLARTWPASVFIWAAVIIGAVSIAAAFWYAQAFSPGAVSRVHVQSSLSGATPTTAIAAQPNANSCTTCHSLNSSMESNCASCHQTDAFASTLTAIPAHAEAGITCASCHSEHQGADFRPAATALQKCAECHNDSNSTLYRGRRVGTPHGGTVGYPVAGGHWTWPGLSDEQWKQRRDAASDMIRKARERLPAETDDQWRSRQFHVLHVHRVLGRDTGLEGGNTDGELSCSSCHKSFEPIDRSTPITTCARCHNGDMGQRDLDGKQTLIAANAANCSSCHVQHVKQPGHWNPKLLAPAARLAADSTTASSH